MRRTLTLSVLLLVLGGCGYSSESECLVKEMQECDSGTCELAARDYCNDEFPSKTKWYIKKEVGYAEFYFNIYTRNSSVLLKKTREVEGRSNYFDICLKEDDSFWSKEKCLNKHFMGGGQTLLGDSWLRFVNDEGTGPKEGAVLTAHQYVPVGFFRWLLDWIFTIFLWVIALGGIAGIIGGIAGFFIADEDEEDEEEELDESEEEDEEVDIPDRAELESMTKGEIKEWADAFELNLPSSLNKAEMIERFIEESNLYNEGSNFWQWVAYIIGGGLLGYYGIGYVLLPLIDKFF